MPELLGAGHEVVGLARSEASAQRLVAAGATVQRGDLDDPDGLRDAAKSADGVIHLAFRHDLLYAGDMAGAAVVDRQAIEVLGEALAGSNRAPCDRLRGLRNRARTQGHRAGWDRSSRRHRWADRRCIRPDGQRPLHRLPRRSRRPLLCLAAPADLPR